MAKLRLEGAARADINATCIAVARRRGERRGEALLDSLMSSIQTLAQFPLLGAAVQGELGARGYRRLSVAERFWCYYTVSDDAVTIHRVLHKGSGIPLLP